MAVFDKTSDYWLCQLNNVSLTLEQKFYCLVNGFNAKWSEIETENEVLKRDIVNNENKIIKVEEKLAIMQQEIDALKESISGIETTRTKVYTSRPLVLGEKVSSTLTVTKEGV